MIKSFGEIDNNLIIEVCNCFEQNYDFNILRENYPFKIDINNLLTKFMLSGIYGSIK